MTKHTSRGKEMRLLLFKLFTEALKATLVIWLNVLLSNKRNTSNDGCKHDEVNPNVSMNCNKGAITSGKPNILLVPRQTTFQKKKTHVLCQLLHDNSFPFL